MVRLVRSAADAAEYWHRLDEHGCSDSRLVQPDKEYLQEDVAREDLGTFFEAVERDPCPWCDWE